MLWGRDELEKDALTPEPLDPAGFDYDFDLPHGLEVEHVKAAMQDFIDFLEFLNVQLHDKEYERLESMLMPATFSGMVGEFMNSVIPNHCPALLKNRYHNGHPDLIPKGHYPGDAAQHGKVGIEVKASRDTGGWQGHNPERSWLIVYVFGSSRPSDPLNDILPQSFRFHAVFCAQMEEEDWKFSGRGQNSRRTPTAGTNKQGTRKLRANPIYRATTGIPSALLLTE